MAGRFVEVGLSVAVVETLSACGGGGGNAAYAPNVAAQTVAPVKACVDCAANTVPRFAYALNAAGATLSIYNVDATTGQLRARGYVKTGANPVSAVSDAKQRFLFVLNQGTVSVYALDNVTGDLKEVNGGPYPISGEAAAHIAIHPSGKFAYVVGSDG